MSGVRTDRLPSEENSASFCVRLPSTQRFAICSVHAAGGFLREVTVCTLHSVRERASRSFPDKKKNSLRVLYRIG